MSSTSKRLSGKYVFQLTDIDVNKICRKYGLVDGVSDEDTTPDPLPSNTTLLADLNQDRVIPNSLSFLDELKKPHKCMVSFIDSHSEYEIGHLESKCFWCRHSFTNPAVGCPISYVPARVVRRHESAVSREVYTIKENVTSRVAARLANERDSPWLEDTAHYITDGVFCSFNCCQAYINDNKHNSLYDESTTLLARIYNKALSKTNVKVSPAPSWRLLTDYGGELSIDKFRESLNKVDYIHHGECTNLSFRPMGTLYEQKLKF